MKGSSWSRVLVIILIILAVLAGVTFWWIKSGKAVKTLAPEIRLSGMNITDITEDKIILMSKTVLNNHFPVGITIKDVSIKLYIDSVKVLESTYPRSIELKRSDSAVINLPLEIEKNKLKSLLEVFEKQDRDSADYLVKSNFKLKFPVAGKREFALNITKRLPAIREVQVKPGKLKIEKLGFKDSKLKMEIIVTNRNVFPIKIKDGRYGLKLEKDLDIAGKLQEMANVPARGSSSITMWMDLKTLKIPKLGWKLLFRKKQTSYDFDFSGTMISENEMMNDAKMVTHASGTLDDIGNLLK